MNRNPSRLSRMPGATRNGNRQYLAAVNIGRKSWADWMDFVEGVSDDLPDMVSLYAYQNAPPELPEELIEGVLRRGHKMLIAGSSKAGKSCLLMELCIAIAEGMTWLGFACRQGRVLYVNLEIDPASAINRFLKIYEALGMSNNEKNRIFGVSEVSKSDVESMVHRYKVEIGNDGEPDYTCQRVLRDSEGNYYLLINGSTGASFFSRNCHLCGGGVLIPITQEALTLWAEANLCGEEYDSAINELKYVPDSFEHETVWQFENDNLYEFLWKIGDDLYMLFSTDGGYPYPCSNSLYVEFDEDGICRDDLYLYYIPASTARRWAEIRGMDEHTCNTVFG